MPRSPALGSLRLCYLLVSCPRDGLSSQTNRYSMVNGQQRIAEVSASTSIDARGKKQIEREQANKV